MQKQSNLNIVDSFSNVINDPSLVVRVIENNNYTASNDSAHIYFDSMDSIIENEKLLNGALAYQILSSVTPRLFFSNKADTDFSLIMWSKKLLPQPLYYEIFLEPAIDSSIYGIVFYHFSLLFFVSISWYSLNKFNSGFNVLYFRSVYILNLIVLFMIIRGPVIFLVWYSLLPNMLLWFLLLKIRFTKNKHLRLNI